MLGGAGTWLIGAPNSVHLGLSGVIFAYLGFLIVGAIFDRSFLAILLSLVVAVLYGGMIWGILPGEAGVSWESHLSGFLSGAFASRFGRKREKRKK